MNALTNVAAPIGSALMEKVLAEGRLEDLTPAERVSYYNAVCQSRGLNPLTRPFEFVKLSGRLVMYARRDCADQLRKLDGVSVEVVSRSVVDGICVVHVRARTPDGRTDEDFGTVPMGNLQGEAKANAILKAITKAKRRVTLSICGLGMMDETEVESVPNREPVEAPPRPDRRRSPAQMRAQAGMPPVMDGHAEEAPPPPPPAPAEPLPPAWEIVSRTGEVKAYPDAQEWRRQWSFRLTSIERAEYPAAQRLRTIGAVLTVNNEAFEALEQAGEGDWVEDVLEQARAAQQRLQALADAPAAEPEIPGDAEAPAPVL